MFNSYMLTFLSIFYFFFFLLTFWTLFVTLETLGLIIFKHLKSIWLLDMMPFMWLLPTTAALQTSYQNWFRTLLGERESYDYSDSFSYL